MYPSDYGYAVEESVRNNCLAKNIFDYNSDDCYQNDWLYIITNQLLLTQSSSYSQVALKIRTDGSVNAFTNCDGANSVSPVVYLKKNVKIISNPYPDKIYGSINNPILLAP